MTHSTLHFIREEHRALAAMLRSIPLMLAANRDPLTGHEPSADYRARFTRILSVVSAPI